ncbi:MAG: NifB/NifX family molybdenum-iron cluster-binding protein [Pseudomonadota bacterium]
MKIAVSAFGEDLNAQINPRFGRCDYLLIVDTDTMAVDAYSNESRNLSGGAGIQSASFVISKGIKALLTGDCGPKAMDVFSTANVAVYTGQTGTVQQAVDRFKQGGLKAAAGATVPEKSGVNQTQTGSGSGRGLGTGSGCRMGGGGGRGMGGGGRGMGGGCGGMGRQR